MAHHAPGAIFILNTCPQHPTPQGIFLCPVKITFQVVYGLGWALDLPFLLLLFLWGVADPDQICFASISLFVLCPLKSPSHFPAIYSQFAWAKNHPVLYVTEIFHGFPIFGEIIIMLGFWSEILFGIFSLVYVRHLGARVFANLLFSFRDPRICLAHQAPIFLLEISSVAASIGIVFLGVFYP